MTTKARKKPGPRPKPKPIGFASGLLDGGTRVAHFADMGKKGEILVESKAVQRQGRSVVTLDDAAWRLLNGARILTVEFADSALFGSRLEALEALLLRQTARLDQAAEIYAQAHRARDSVVKAIAVAAPQDKKAKRKRRGAA